MSVKFVGASKSLSKLVLHFWLGFVALLCCLPTKAGIIDDILFGAHDSSAATKSELTELKHLLFSENEVCGGKERTMQNLRLADAITITLCNNPRLKSAIADIKAREAEVGQAKATFYPTMSANINRQTAQTDYVGLPIPSSRVTGSSVYTSLTWRLFDFGARGHSLDAANSRMLAAVFDSDAELEKSLTAVIQAYFEVGTNEAAWRSRVRVSQISQETLESCKRRERSGAASLSDALQAQTANSRAILEENRASGIYKKSLSELSYAMGLPPGTAISAVSNVEFDNNGTESNGSFRSEIESLRSWLEQAKETHPSIRAARAQWRAAISEVEAERSGDKPTVDFSYNFYKNGYPGQAVSSGSQVHTVGVALTIPIFDGFAKKYKIHEALAKADQLEHQLADVEQQVLKETVSTYTDAVTARRNLEASAILLTSANDALASVKRRYEKGAAEIIEVLSVQGALADASQERIRCIAEWRSARLRLLATAGKVDKVAMEAGANTDNSSETSIRLSH